MLLKRAVGLADRRLPQAVPSRQGCEMHKASEPGSQDRWPRPVGPAEMQVPRGATSVLAALGWGLCLQGSPGPACVLRLAPLKTLGGVRSEFT